MDMGVFCSSHTEGVANTTAVIKGGISRGLLRGCFGTFFSSLLVFLAQKQEGVIGDDSRETKKYQDILPLD